MNAKLLSSVLSLLVLLVWATVASAQNVLLFTFDDSGPNVTATVTGSFNTSGLNFAGRSMPIDPPGFLFAVSTTHSFGTTAATNIDQYNGADFGPPVNDGAFSFLFDFPGGEIITPLSEYLDINVPAMEMFFPEGATIGLAEGQTSFNADALANNVIVFELSSIEELGDSGFLSTTPTTVLSVPNGGDTIQFVLAAPEILLCDVNLDGEVNFSDIPPFIEALLSDTYLAEADCDSDGEVSFSDIPPFIAILIGG